MIIAYFLIYVTSLSLIMSSPAEDICGLEKVKISFYRDSDLMIFDEPYVWKIKKHTLENLSAKMPVQVERRYRYGYWNAIPGNVTSGCSASQDKWKVYIFIAGSQVYFNAIGDLDGYENRHYAQFEIEDGFNPSCIKCNISKYPRESARFTIDTSVEMFDAKLVQGRNMVLRVACEKRYLLCDEKSVQEWTVTATRGSRLDRSDFGQLLKHVLGDEPCHAYAHGSPSLVFSEDRFYILNMTSNSYNFNNDQPKVSAKLITDRVLFGCHHRGLTHTLILVLIFIVTAGIITAIPMWYYILTHPIMKPDRSKSTSTQKKDEKTPEAPELVPFEYNESGITTGPLMVPELVLFRASRRPFQGFIPKPKVNMTTVDTELTVKTIKSY